MSVHGFTAEELFDLVTGQLAGASMYDILMTLGREKVMRRLRDVDKFFQ